MNGFTQRLTWLLHSFAGLVVCASVLSTSKVTAEPFSTATYNALGPLRRPEPPVVEQIERVRTPIDRFILSRLEEAGLSYAPDVDSRTLIRRAYLDLVGLPPPPEEVEAFVADNAGDAYERLIDRLLVSPHFGERWGRHWLDAAGYVDVYGSDENAPAIRVSPGRWKYRDYVVQSLNNDKPYDRFLLEQLAGDELVDWRNAEEFSPETKTLLIATGFLRTGIDDTDQDVLNIPSNRYAVIFDQIEIFGSCVLGLTVQCARCHDHKYDPISQEDYYRLMANFTPAYNPDAWVKLDKRSLPDVPPAVKQEIDAHNLQCDKRITEIERKIFTLTSEARGRLLDAHVESLPEAIRDDVKRALERPPAERDNVQEYLAGKFEFSSSDVDSQLDVLQQATVAELRREMAAINDSRSSYDWIQALYDTGPAPQTRLLEGGDFERPDLAVEPGGLSALSNGDPTLKPAVDARGKTTGRRLALAQWLTKTGTPAEGLVARVAVNRVWHHLLGRGIVETPGYVGVGGEPPTHPELLDWLASRFVEDDWKLKTLIRLVMTSTVYRQASALVDSEASKRAQSIDPDDKLLWRVRLRRMDAEIVRDAILASTGKLDTSAGGPPVPVEVRDDGEVAIATKGLPALTSQWRRSLYILLRRNYHPTMLGAFDIPVMSTNCTHRDHSTAVTQSLTLLNDRFMFEQADAFADRLNRESGVHAQARIDRAFQLAYARRPTSKESARASTLLLDQTANYRRHGISAEEAEKKALANLCHMLLCSNEFLYVE